MVAPSAPLTRVVGVVILPEPNSAGVRDGDDRDRREGQGLAAVSRVLGVRRDPCPAVLEASGSLAGSLEGGGDGV